tara:strand:+ start:20404 stop:20733 length:330 start_codon:yes stop_codon:yes gene_type:complete
MDIQRLPTSQSQEPLLMGSYNHDTRTVKWCLNDDENYDRQDFSDGTNWFTVWRHNEMIHVRATQWYHSRGDFCMRITDVSPDQAVALAERCSFNANDMIDGNTGLENLT